MLTLPAWRLGPDSSGLLIVRVDPSLGLSLLQVENWLGFGTPRVVAKFALEGADGPALLALPEAGLKISEARLVAVRHDGTAAAARIRVGSASVAAGGDHSRGAKGVAAVLTSCGRQDLLEKTLDSFFACNTYPLAQTIIVEDGPQEANSHLQKKYVDRDITWLSTGKRIGQIAAIDYAYSFIEQPYIFHLEDDWQFYQAGFIEKSLTILEALPDCLQVWIRALHDTNRTPIPPRRRQSIGSRSNASKADILANGTDFRSIRDCVERAITTASENSPGMCGTTRAIRTPPSGRFLPCTKNWAFTP